jgi:hypothetical protein
MVETPPVRGSAVVVLATVVLVLLATRVSADPLSAAKAGGYVGERYDGYVGLVHADAPAAVKRLVTDINAERREKYEAIAKRNGTSIDAVAVLAGRKLVGRARPGEYVLGPKGVWVKKGLVGSDS